MPCDTFALRQEEKRQRDKALKELADDVAAGRKQIVTGFDGSMTIMDFDTSAAAQAGWAEACACAALAEMDDWALQSTLQSAGVNKAATIKRHGH